MSGSSAPEIAAVLGHKTLDMVKRYLAQPHTADVVGRMTEKFPRPAAREPSASTNRINQLDDG